jgi:hypothetical protein
VLAATVPAVPFSAEVNEAFYGEATLPMFAVDHDPQVRVIKYAPLAGVVLAGDVDAGLFVEPPRRQPQILGYGARFFNDDAVGNEHGVDITGNPGRVIRQRHRCPAHHEQVGDNAAASEPLAQSREGTLQVGTAHEDPAGVCHFAVRSWAER